MSLDKPRGRVLLLAFVVACAALLPAAHSVGRAQDAASSAARERPRRVATPAAARAELRADVGEDVAEGEVVRVETQLVSVPVLVTDHEGRALKGLRAEDFLLLEDGRPQKIANFSTTEAPFEVALLLDTSGSTRAEVGLIRGAALDFIGALRRGDSVAVLSFESGGNGGRGLATVGIKSPLTDDRDELREAIESVSTSNGTPFYDGLEKVAMGIFRERPGEESGGRRALVALSDGVDSASESDFEAARATLKRAGVVVYFIQLNTEEYVEEGLLRGCEGGGLRLSRAQLRRYRKLVAPNANAEEFSDFCRMGPFERMHANRTLYDLARREMETLARDSGGGSFPVASLRDARGAFRQVAEELGTQYALSYYPTNKARDGAYRAITVRVRGARDARVRAREGYQAPKG
ncbi:MAG: VWA domain-containing protein [Pyrinomonadaceae bacterium]